LLCLASVAAEFSLEAMLVAFWIVFFLFMLFLLGSVVGSFLNVCIVRLPEGRSLVRPASCCGQCGKLIRWQDNIPLLSYWLLRGRCRACGAAFSMRYFWIELLTGFVFVLIYYLEIGRNIHHFQLLRWYENDFAYLLTGMFRPLPWLLFLVHALLSCFLIVAAMTNREHHKVPCSVTSYGLLLGLVAAVLFPWPWPDPPIVALRVVSGEWGAGSDEGSSFSPLPTPHSPLPTLREGLYPWPVWGPLPDWLPVSSWQLGLATGLAGILAGAAWTGLVRLPFNIGVGAAALGRGEMSLLMIAGAFLGWQPVVTAGLLALLPGLASATVQWTVKKRARVSYSLWLALSVASVWLGWHWIGPLVQGLFFDLGRTILLAIGCVSGLVAFAVCLRLAGVARSGMRA
jgi:leader peptidase (prepilin peptidase)/N-methyltransferase